MMPRSWPRSMPETSSCSDVKAWIESGVLWRSVSRRVAVTTISSSWAEAAKGRAPTTAAANVETRKVLQDMKPPKKRQDANDKKRDHSILPAAATQSLVLGKKIGVAAALQLRQRRASHSRDLWLQKKRRPEGRLPIGTPNRV